MIKAAPPLFASSVIQHCWLRTCGPLNRAHRSLSPNTLNEELDNLTWTRTYTAPALCPKGADRLQTALAQVLHQCRAFCACMASHNVASILPRRKLSCIAHADCLAANCICHLQDQLQTSQSWEPCRLHVTPCRELPAEAATGAGLPQC